MTMMSNIEQGRGRRRSGMVAFSTSCHNAPTLDFFRAIMMMMRAKMKRRARRRRMMMMSRRIRTRRKEKIRDGCFFSFSPQCSLGSFNCGRMAIGFTLDF